MLTLLTDDARFPHVQAALLAGTWLLVVGARVLAGERTPLAVLASLSVVAAPYASARLGMVLLSAGLLAAAASLERLSAARDPARRAAGVAFAAAMLSGGLLVLGGAGLMALTPGGAREWSWWIGLGTAVYGGLAAVWRGLGVRRHGRAALGLAAAGVLAAPGVSAQAAGEIDAVDRYLRDELRRQRIPGFSVAVLRGGTVLLARGYGYANVEHRVPATDSSVYQSGSLGKMFTAALVLQLADSGRLGLDDPIRRHLPEGPARWDSVTVRHLLTHTAGIPDYTDSVVDLRRDYTEEELVGIAAGLRPLFRAGERWSYSNTGYVLLGVILRRVGGRFYGDLLGERIFAPLGMRAARVISEADIVPNRSAGYRLVGETLQNQEWVSPALNTTADGSLYVTVNDLARWVTALDAHRVLGVRSLEAAWTPVRLNDGSRYPYGFGWTVGELRTQPRIGHSGSWQGFRTALERFPRAGLTVIVLANLAQARPEAIALGVAGILEPSLAPPHRLAAPLPGPRPPAPADTVLRHLARDDGSGALAPGLRRFLAPSDRREWGELASTVGSWMPLGCDRVSAPAIARSGAPVKWICYARGVDSSGGVVLTTYYTQGWRVADAESYRY